MVPSLAVGQDMENIVGTKKKIGRGWKITDYALSSDHLEPEPEPKLELESELKPELELELELDPVRLVMLDLPVQCLRIQGCFTTSSRGIL